MKRFFVSCLLLFVLPALASADYWDIRCDGNSCRRVLVREAPRVVVAATPAEYVSFDPEPVGNIRLASYAPPAAASFYSAADPVDFAAASRIVSVGPPVVTSSTCACATSGYCTCAPGTCACPGCPSNARALQSSPGMATYGNLRKLSATDSAGRIIYTPSGHVHVYADGSTMHSGGHVQRKVARQERWRAARGIQ